MILHSRPISRHPNLKLGGPSFEGVIEDVEVWPDSESRVSWLPRIS
jgi:hypothetical protein